MIFTPPFALWLDDYSEPQPDLMLLKPRADFYRSAHPRAEEVLLLVEVAESSLAYDREIKIPLYARRYIPEVWLFDLPGKRLEIHLEPAAEGYKKILRPGRKELVAPHLLPDIAIRWEEAL